MGDTDGANGINTSQLSTTYTSRDQRGVTLATLGQGDIRIQDPEASDDLSGLNRDTTRTDRELYRIEQQRQIDLTVDHRLLGEEGRAEIREQIATLPATVKATYDEVATQIALLTHPAPDAAVDAGGQITEDLYEALIRRGYSLEDATAILADEAFQDQVLASIKTIAEVSGPLMGGETPAEEAPSAPADAALPNAYYDDQGQPVVELETVVVTAEWLPDTPAQVVLKGASEINAYLEQHPEQQRIVEIGFAVAQGPKGVIGLLVGEALANSPVGEALGEKFYEAGELVAERVEGYDLYGDQDEQDRYLIGGGTFAAGIVLGGIIPDGKRGSGEHAGGSAGNSAPELTIRDHYTHHKGMVDDLMEQLEDRGYRISDREVSFGSSCGTGRCRPDIIYETPDGKMGIIEVKTGNADLTIRQSEIYPQINSGDAIPRGKVARDFGLDPGVPLREQGYPNGIPIEIREFPGAGQ